MSQWDMIKHHSGLFVQMKAISHLTCILLAPVWFLILTTWADGWQSARLAAFFHAHTSVKPPPGFKGGGGNDGGGLNPASYCQPHAPIYITHIPIMLQSPCHKRTTEFTMFFFFPADSIIINSGYCSTCALYKCKCFKCCKLDIKIQLSLKQQDANGL